MCHTGKDKHKLDALIVKDVNILHLKISCGTIKHDCRLNINHDKRDHFTIQTHYIADIYMHMSVDRENYNNGSRRQSDLCNVRIVLTFRHSVCIFGIQYTKIKLLHSNKFRLA